jgi:endonuclease/exonuclease/phosphatase family metal-dependent hydrolase
MPRVARPRLATLTLAALAALLPGAWASAQGRADTEIAPVRLASFNIRYGTANDGENAWENRREMVAGLIDTLDADVLGLQEALRFQLDEIGSARPGYAEVGVGRDDGRSRGEHSTILVRTSRFAIASAGTFWLSDTPEAAGSTHWGNTIPRVCTWARLVERGSGRVLWVYNTHLDHRSQPSRERSVELITSHIALHAGDEPVVLMGDLNAGEDNAAVAYLLGRTERASDTAAWPGHTPPPAPGLTDTFRALHPDAAEVGTFTGFRLGATGGPKIDHLLVSEGLAVLEAGIDRTSRGGRYPSDHFPVWAVVDWR